MFIENEPKIGEREGCTVVGVERYTSDGIGTIRKAWDELYARMNEIEHATKVLYGYEDFSRDLVMPPGEFPKYYYLASVQVSSLGKVPEGMRSRDIPAATFATFTHRGPIDGLRESFTYIYGEWMPKSGYKVDPNVAGDYERYPEGVDDIQNVIVEICVPIVKRQPKP